MPSESAAKDPANPSAAPATWQVDEARHREAAQRFDRWLQAGASRFIAGLSPVSLALASTEWALRLWSHPAESTWLALRAPQLAADVLARTAHGDGPGREDARFAHPAWQGWPWSAMALSQQAAQAWWREATALRGMDHHHRDMMGFFARQWLDALSPSNVGPLNPEVMERTVKEKGANLGRGAANAVDDWRRRHALAPLQQAEHAWRPGQDLAITPGKVVYRNELVELIQYLPLTSTVQAEPVFIVPSWIMKYYILDLQPHNSMVRWLVEQGHTVFILSWRNPDESDAQRGMADYLQLGVFDCLAAIAKLLPGVAVHACGYCLGGTLLSLAAAALARPSGVEPADALAPLASVSLLAAETDFSEPGEMGVLIDEPQVELLEAMMAERGFLTGPQMAGSFAYLHARDQVWARRLRELWLGESQETNDLMAWNADVTRMPAAMHSEYLRRCYLHNEIAEGRFPVQGRPVSLADIRQPMFVVGTETDHVSPWKSVYKIHQLTSAPLTFVLTSGGHNAGIVSEPGHAHRHYALRLRLADGAWTDPDHWAAGAQRFEGSWWTAWHDWLLQQGSGKTVKARRPAASQVLGDAPGHYVHQRYDDPPT